VKALGDEAWLEHASVSSTNAIAHPPTRRVLVIRLSPHTPSTVT